MATMRENASIVISAARQMKAIIELAEQIGEIEVVESQLAEKVAEYNGMFSQLMEVRKALADAEAETIVAKEEGQKLRREATAAAKLIKEKAEIAAKAMTSDAQKEAVALVAKAKREAGSWDQRVVVARDEFDKKTAELADLDKKLASVQSKIEKLVKGLTDGNV